MTDRDRPLRPTDRFGRPTGSSRPVDHATATDRLWTTAASTATGRIALGTNGASVTLDEAKTLLHVADRVSLTEHNGWESLVLDRAGFGPVVLLLVDPPKADPWARRPPGE